MLFPAHWLSPLAWHNLYDCEGMSWVNYNCYMLEPAIAYYSRKCVSLHHLLPCLLANRINAFLRHMQRFGYLQCRITVAELMNKSDHDLFCKLCALTHALNNLLPPTSNRASLRTRGHLYQLPEYSTDLRKKSFLIRSLYSFVKWNIFLVLLLCTVRHSDCFLCLFFDVRLSHLINITYIHTYLLTCCRAARKSAQRECGTRNVIVRDAASDVISAGQSAADYVMAGQLQHGWTACETTGVSLRSRP